jgi:Arc/MetJ-type ribon-helix-helix transcriptional regulator
MRLSVVIPPELEEELDELKESEGKTTSVIVREALDLYSRQVRRRRAGDALLEAARSHPLEDDRVDAVLAGLERDRGRSDRL